MLDNLNAIIDKIVGSGLGYLWFLLLAIWGGTVNYIGRVKQGNPQRFSLFELVGEWAISGFVGVVTIYICLEMDLSTYMTGALVAISGHMGGRAIHLIEQYVCRKLPIPRSHIHRRKDDEDV